MTCEPNGPDPSFLRAIAETRRFTLGYPSRILPSPDDKTVLFLRSPARSPNLSLYEFDIAMGNAHELISPAEFLKGGQEELTAAERARRERMRIATQGLNTYELSPDGQRILLPLSGKLYIYERGDAKVQVLLDSELSILDPRFSPDGSKVAYVKEYDVFVADIETGAEVAVTRGGTEQVTHGIAEFVAQEEMERFEGYWWSPDGQLIAFEEADHTSVEPFTIADLANPTCAPQMFRYPRPGKANVKVRIGIISITGGEEPIWVKWDVERYPYLGRIIWKEKAAPLTMLVQSRDQREEALLAVDLRTGETRVLLVEQDAAWVELIPSVPRWLPDGSGFLWASDRSGRRKLELRGPSGVLQRVLLTGQDPFYEIVHVSQDSRVVHALTATPTSTSLVRIPLDGGPISTVAAGAGDQVSEYGAVFSKSGGMYVLTQTSVSDLPKSEIYRGDGTYLAELPTTAEQPPFLPQTEILTVRGLSGRSYMAAIVRPRDFDRDKRYPVVVDVYGGPHWLTVRSDLRAYCLPQWFADHGAVVILIDNRGTPRRNHAWERAIKGSFARVPLDDQVEALQALGSRYRELDLSRVGIYGWSFGGYMAALAVLKRPDVFKVGVAGAPVVEWLDYDTHYTERYLDLPEQNQRGYEESSLLTYVDRLERPLLLIHGTRDDNVYFFHTLKLADALFKAGRPFQFLPLVGLSHLITDPVVVELFHERILEFLMSNLQG